jgi:hypothetical protein
MYHTVMYLNIFVYGLFNDAAAAQNDKTVNE